MPLLFDDSKIFSIRLKDARKSMNLTQAKCAEYLNISTTFYKELERNQSSPSLELYYKICRNMHISADSCIFPLSIWYTYKTCKKFRQHFGLFHSLSIHTKTVLLQRFCRQQLTQCITVHIDPFSHFLLLFCFGFTYKRFFFYIC